MEAELTQTFSNLSVELISSGGGVFEVSLNGELIFSKKSLNRFPEDGEVRSIIEKST